MSRFLPGGEPQPVISSACATGRHDQCETPWCYCLTCHEMDPVTDTRKLAPLGFTRKPPARGGRR